MKIHSPQPARRSTAVLLLVSMSFTGCGSDDAQPESNSTVQQHESPATNSGSTIALDGPDPAIVDPGPPAVADTTNPTESGHQPVGSEEPTSPVDSTDWDGAPVRPLVFRPTWPKPEYSDDSLRRAMLERFTAPGFELITDMGPEKSRPLLALVEPLHRYHESYFGPLPRAADKSDYAVTAYVMRDQTLFENAGMLPDGGLLAFHGRQIGPQFWMNDQPWDYYRRHLLLHEATHAYMRHLPGKAVDLPLWYLEGMAELLATHTIDDRGAVTFNIMPVDPQQFIGHERIAIVRRDIRQNGLRTIEQITTAEANDFANVETYAWCWALCRFLDSHPRYQERFRQLARELIWKPLTPTLADLFQEDNDRLRVEWAAFASGIEYGYDFERTQLVTPGGQPLAGAITTNVESDRGWQSTGITVQQGQTISVTADGSFTLADNPKPWTSEANGISFRYYDGQPLGRLVAAIIQLEGDQANVTGPLPLGNAARLEAPASGTLYLRLNDHWGELADNRGRVSVTIEPGVTR